MLGSRGNGRREAYIMKQRGLCTVRSVALALLLISACNGGSDNSGSFAGPLNLCKDCDPWAKLIVFGGDHLLALLRARQELQTDLLDPAIRDLETLECSGARHEDLDLAYPPAMLSRSRRAGCPGLLLDDLRWAGQRCDYNCEKPWGRK